MKLSANLLLVRSGPGDGVESDMIYQIICGVCGLWTAETQFCLLMPQPGKRVSHYYTLQKL